MIFQHLCSVYRKMPGENPINEDLTDISPVVDMQAQPCFYAVVKNMGKRDETAESLQTEQSLLLVPTGTDIRKGDTIKQVRFPGGMLLKDSIFIVETFTEKPSMITGPHHRTLELKEVA